MQYIAIPSQNQRFVLGRRVRYAVIQVMLISHNVFNDALLYLCIRSRCTGRIEHYLFKKRILGGPQYFYINVLHRNTFKKTQSLTYSEREAIGSPILRWYFCIFRFFHQCLQRLRQRLLGRYMYIL